MPPDRLLSKPEPDPHKHCNYVTLKEEIEDLMNAEVIPMEKGRKIMMAGSEERNNGGRTTTFEDNDTVEYFFP